MKSFLQRHADNILGVLSCFDRDRFRGSLGMLSHVPGVASWLEALGQFDAALPLSKLTDKLCLPMTVQVEGRDGTQRQRRHRGLRSFDAEEVRLLRTISSGEFEIAGFRNCDVREGLSGTSLSGAGEDASERRRQAGRVSRLLGMLRAHGLIKKIPRTHRDLLTTAGRPAIAA